MDEFLLRALLAGLGVAMVAGPLGSFVVWRRMAYFGAALSHSALLGVSLGFLLDISPSLGILGLCLLLAIGLSFLERRRFLATDTLLGIMAHASLALGLVVLAFLEDLRVDLVVYLFGDVLSVSWEDVYLIVGLGVFVSLVLALIWRPLLSVTINEELASVEGVKVRHIQLIFVLLLALVIAVGMKVVGVLLIISLLIIPAAAARPLSKNPESMAVGAAIIGALSVAVGLWGSLLWDIPAGPAMVVSATALFLITRSFSD